MGDYIGFILPISQFENSDSLYHFDLIKSVDLGVLEYSNMKSTLLFQFIPKTRGKRIN